MTERNEIKKTVEEKLASVGDLGMETLSATASFESCREAQQDYLQFDALDKLIAGSSKILYQGEDFSDDRVVKKFVADHRPLNSAMLGSWLGLYEDPCGCCVPSYGTRDLQPGLNDVAQVINYVKQAAEGGKALDLLFVSEMMFEGVSAGIREIAPEIKVIVACDRFTDSDASDLRKKGIPATDDDDYLKCAPLNAVIALAVFGELMRSADQ